MTSTLPGPEDELPVFLQKDRAETRQLDLRSVGGDAIPVTGGTYSLLDASGTAVINAQAVTVTNGVASYSVPSTFADDHTLPQDTWREKWEMTGVGGGGPTTMTFEREAMVCRVAPVRHVSLRTLVRMHSQWSRTLPKLRPDPGEFIEDAWVELIKRMLGDGILPHRVLNWHTMSVVHKYWAAHLVCRDLQTDTSSPTKWDDLADDYWSRVQTEYEHQLGLVVDNDEDGVDEDPGTLTGAEPPLFLTDVPWTCPTTRGHW